MLNWRNVRLIFLREVRDQLRDRRTLFMIAVLPLLLYPAMGLGMMQLNVLFREQPRTVVLLGADQLPSEPPLLDGRRFAPDWFPKSADPGRLLVLSDAPPAAGAAPLPESVNADALLALAREVRAALSQGRSAAGRLFGPSGLQAVVIIPEGFGKDLQRVREELAARNGGGAVATDYPRPTVVYNKADEKSQITFNRVTDVLEAWEARILEGWLELADLQGSFTHPVLGEPVDVALEEQMAASIWGRLFPALLIVMSVTGAFYPAIDLVAGEKERGTMETLLICPATRPEIVVGKFLTVMLFSCTTALLNLASMGFTGRHMVTMAPAAALGQSAGLALPPVWAIAWVLVLLVPLAALFSALCLALATFARSSKEGQYYLTPLLMVTLGLTVFCLSPGVELNPRYSLMPIVGVALLLKGLLLSPLHAGGLYHYVLPVLASSIGYSVLALWWAIDQFNREEVLFREAERFELRLWFRHLLRDKERTPSFSEAAFCFVLIMLLQFFSLKYLQQRLVLADDAAKPGLMLNLLLVQQLAIIATPALMMGVILTTSLRDTFSLRWPEWKMLAAALVLPLAVHPLSYETLARLRWLLGEIPPETARELAFLSDASQPLWLVVLTVALAPAFCEEVAFRGFILRGLNRGGRTVLAIVFSSLAFGVMHMIPQQVFNASLIGLVLGALTIRSRSLLPAMTFHFVNNTLWILHGRWSGLAAERLPANPFVSLEEGALRYEWPMLVVCVVIAAPIVHWLVQPLFSRRQAAAPLPSLPGALSPVGSVVTKGT